MRKYITYFKTYYPGLSPYVGKVFLCIFGVIVFILIINNGIDDFVVHLLPRIMFPILIGLSIRYLFKFFK